MDLHKKSIRGKPPEKGSRQSNTPPVNDSGDQGQQQVSGEWQAITDWLNKVKFRRQLFGGLEERSVWNKIKELNMLYEDALRAERIRYDTLLEEYRQRSGPAASRQNISLSSDSSHVQPAESG